MKEKENIQIPNEFDNVTEIENTTSYRIVSTQNINDHPQNLNNLFDIKKIDNFKDKIELNNNISDQEIQFEFRNQILSLYGIINKEKIENLDKNLIDPYFNNELFDENYAENNFYLENIKKSILFKKNVLNMDDLILSRYQQNPQPFSAANQIQIDEINQNIKYRNYQFINLLACMG